MTRRFGLAFAILILTTPMVTPGTSNARARGSQQTSEAQKADPWNDLRFLVGSWEGTGVGDPGESRVVRKYEFVLNDQFLFMQNRSVFKPQEKNPKGESHEDWGLFSYDQGRGKIVFRQFHVEGFVTQYVLKEVSADGKTLVFVTEHVENGPPGFRARLTYKVLGNDQLAESFELARSGAEFKPCVNVRISRSK